MSPSDLAICASSAYQAELTQLHQQGNAGNRRPWEWTTDRDREELLLRTELAILGEGDLDSVFGAVARSAAACLALTAA